MTAAEEFYSSYIVLCVFNAFLSYTAIMLNSLTFYAMRKTSSLPKNLKTLLLSLAVSDFGVGLIVQPLYSAVIVMSLQPNFGNSPAYKTTFIAYSASARLLCIASFFGVTALTIDRFLSIYLHLRYQELVTHKRVVAVVISIWVFSVTGVFVAELDPAKKVTSITFATFMIVCLITTAVIYCKIYLAVRHHSNQIHALQIRQEAQNGEIGNAARLRKSAVATFYVYLVFLVCYLPRLCIHVVTFISASSTATEGLQRYAMALVFLNSSVNPLVYCWKMSHVRHVIVDTLRKILTRLFPSHN